MSKQVRPQSFPFAAETAQSTNILNGTVEKAKLLETVKIVTYDWLEESLQSNP
jgi:hypothetical protein